MGYGTFFYWWWGTPFTDIRLYIYRNKGMGECVGTGTHAGGGRVGVAWASGTITQRNNSALINVLLIILNNQ